jgi:hypothetical protein
MHSQILSTLIAWWYLHARLHGVRVVGQPRHPSLSSLSCLGHCQNTCEMHSHRMADSRDGLINCLHLSSTPPINSALYIFSGMSASGTPTPPTSKCETFSSRIWSIASGVAPLAACSLRFDVQNSKIHFEPTRRQMTRKRGNLTQPSRTT